MTAPTCATCAEKDAEISRIQKAAAAIRSVSCVPPQDCYDAKRLYMCWVLSRYIAGDATEAFAREQCKEYGVEI